jgi:hypothetical protein
LVLGVEPRAFRQALLPPSHIPAREENYFKVCLNCLCLGKSYKV